MPYKHSVAKSSTGRDIYWERRSLHGINSCPFGLLLFWMIKCERAESTIEVWGKKQSYFRSCQMLSGFHVSCSSQNCLRLAGRITVYSLGCVGVHLHNLLSFIYIRCSPVSKAKQSSSKLPAVEEEESAAFHARLADTTVNAIPMLRK